MAKTPKFANAKVFDWVDKWNKICTPDKVVVVTGSKEEHTKICEMMVKNGQFIKLNEKKRPGCYLARSHESDVARVEGRTFICSKKEIDAGPTNHWMDPVEMKKKMEKAYKGCMKGRTMYVIPFAMGPIGNPITQYGIEVTDSPYVVVNMNIMTRTGDAVMKYIDTIVVGTGSTEDHTKICEMMDTTGQFIKLNEKKRPGCYLARSHESDVARVEGRTFICSKKEIDAGPTNHWMDPVEMKKKMEKAYK
ncbi:MAG: hypothetical protein PUJ80_06555, partial [Verrucomicrobiota bacterium]|nr:hypothetical protein [Verrucomicrobiota bacterium]